MLMQLWRVGNVFGDLSIETTEGIDFRSLFTGFLADVHEGRWDA